MDKNKLKQFEYLKRYIDQLENDLFVLESRAMKMSPVLTDNKSPKGQVSDSMADVVCKIIEMQNLINNRLTKLYDLQREIENYIDSLEDIIAQYIMRAKYIQCKTWKQIDSEIDYEWAQMHRIHSRCLKEMVKEKQDTN